MTHRLLNVAAAVYIVDTGLRWNRHAPSGFWRFLKWAVLTVIAIPGFAAALAIPFSTTPVTCLVIAVIFLAPLTAYVIFRAR